VLTPVSRPSVAAVTAAEVVDPARVLRFVYVGRMAFATAIFVAAVTQWLGAASAQTLLAALAFVGAMAFTGGSALYSEIWERPLTREFLSLQTLFDLAMVTTVVHVTGGWVSPFSGVYVLVIAVAALWLPIGSSLLVALLGCALYALDTFVFNDTRVETPVLLQTAVFAIVALGSGSIAERLRRAGVGTEALAEELVKVRLQAADVLRALDSGIVTIDAAGHLLYANPAASRLLGIELEMRVGRPVLDDLGRSAPELAGALERTVRDGIRALRADGRITSENRSFPIGVTTTVVGDGAEGSSATAIFQDISDQQRAQALHLRAQRLEAVAELSASLAHEIRNPLAAIRSAVEQLVRRGAANDDERVLGNLITRESDRLSRLLSDFLDFARVRDPRLAVLDLRDVVRHAADVARSHPERASSVTVECMVPDDALPAEVDADQLDQAVLNLVLNALQAMPQGGKLRLEVAAVHADAPRDAAAVRRPAAVLRVIDTGEGLPAVVRERIFEPFITTKPGGSGLGLPMVHRAAEAHGGAVLVDSDANGTRFALYLPLHLPRTIPS
jgi:two-component system sensor histidine kinase PilS (NtrC family)